MSKGADAIGHQQRVILGVTFFGGPASAAIAKMGNGGLLAVPAAPALKQINRDCAYRDSLLASDLVISDSALMVLVWNLLERDSLPRLSGLEYLRELLLRQEVRQTRNTLWIMASPKSAATNRCWLADAGVAVEPEYIYIAPTYGCLVQDPELLARIDRLRPQHVIITLGGGTQERLGLYLKQNLSYLPVIHCIGAAMAFLSGDQVRIPVWADRYYLGWLLRCISGPRRYIPRYWKAWELVLLIFQYRKDLPPLRN